MMANGPSAGELEASSSAIDGPIEELRRAVNGFAPVPGSDFNMVYWVYHHCLTKLSHYHVASTSTNIVDQNIL